MVTFCLKKCRLAGSRLQNGLVEPRSMRFCDDVRGRRASAGGRQGECGGQETTVAVTIQLLYASNY